MESLNVVGSLDALAHESRLAIFRQLVEAGPDGLMVGAIGETLNLPAATLSFHLTKLRDAGLVHRRREGRAALYSADYERLLGVMRFLLTNCCRDVADPSRRFELIETKECC